MENRFFPIFWKKCVGVGSILLCTGCKTGRFHEKTQKCLGPFFSAPRPKMSNGVQRWGQRAPSRSYPRSFFRRFSRRIPPPKSAKSGNTTITHVSWTHCSLCYSRGSASRTSRRISGFSEMFSVLCGLKIYFWKIPSESPRIPK